MEQNTSYKDLKNKGFTLVEIVVIIAIMIVLLAILTPSLLRYVEGSRMQKDDTAMDELCGTVQLALADAETFDEACSYAILNNYVTYTDSSGIYGAQYVDEEFWAPDGSGHAVTITFNPDENGNYTIANGLVNDMTYGNGSVADSRTADDLKQCYFSEMGDGKLYHKVEQTFGATFNEKSATYNNSSYTVFIKLDVVNGIKRANVYGEWNGTNLSPDCPASLGSGTNSYTEEEEPEQTKTGGTTQSNYTSSDLQGGGGSSGNTPNYKNYLPCGHVYGSAGNHNEQGCGHYACENCECVPASCGIDGHYEGDDKGEHGIAVTRYNCYSGHTYTCECSGWVIPEGGVYKRSGQGDRTGGQTLPCGFEAKDNDRFTYGDYEYCYGRGYYTNIGWQKFEGQNGWGVRILNRTQTSYGPILEEINNIPIKSLRGLFFYCEQLTDMGDFIIPESVTNVCQMFGYCFNLTQAPVIPKNVTDVSYTFNGCNKLLGTTVTIHGTPTSYNICFYYIDMSQITLAGNCPTDVKIAIANTGKNGNQVKISN